MSPRPARIQAAGAIYHGYVRATGGALMFRDGGDRDRLLSILAATVDRYEWEVHFVTVLGTHYHAVFTTTKPNIAAGMQYLNGLYCRSFNRKYERKGHLLGSRYGSELVESERHGAALVPYLALNAVRASLVGRPEDWPWSSYASLIGLTRPWSFIAPGWLLDQFGDDQEEAGAALRDVVERMLVEESLAT